MLWRMEGNKGMGSTHMMSPEWPEKSKRSTSVMLQVEWTSFVCLRRETGALWLKILDDKMSVFTYLKVEHVLCLYITPRLKKKTHPEVMYTA